jgi:NAD(P)-dependent dehydrogenase (short-subunit alcohol dehydrogenase family)
MNSMIANAGIAPEALDPQPVWSFSESAFDATMTTNAKGVFLCCKYTAAQMMKQEPGPTGDRGWIVNVGSIVGIVGNTRAGMLCCGLGANFAKKFISYSPLLVKFALSVFWTDKLANI